MTVITQAPVLIQQPWYDNWPGKGNSLQGHSGMSPSTCWDKAAYPALLAGTKRNMPLYLLGQSGISRSTCWDKAAYAAILVGTKRHSSLFLLGQSGIPYSTCWDKAA
ncbi:hypothetical protein AVEN_204804-1 [Araneus ventricosus]|uniref:Uncharacterized protein n=1 Tax=Araneus ventricosus TaxID=182803 RepID=A0A4Y2BMJ5_ARAVE|nr:hypothetical protein AVEN_14327-1 [Araneus ventricosus]GBL93283.1 hypothetical protein AVEN_204804-1 [Araneus ventricosus]